MASQRLTAHRHAAAGSLLLFAFAQAGVVAGSAQADAPPRWSPRIAAAREYAERRQGGISFAVRSDRRGYGYRRDRVVPSASVVKPMLMVAYLNRASVRGRRLRAAERRLLAPMIRRSDSAAASVIRNVVGSAGLRRVARRAGMRRFQPVAHPWGLSRVTAADQARFFLRIDHLVPRRHRRRAMRLLGSVVPSQRWGVGAVKPRGWDLFFKGGWGSGTGWVEHQVALLKKGRYRVAVAVMTTSSPSHAYGIRTLRGVFRRLLRGLRGAGNVHGQFLG